MASQICFLCYIPADDARICPNCLTFYCSTCISSWIGNFVPGASRCPQCKQSLIEEALLKANASNKRESSAKVMADDTTSDVCLKHRTPITLFCKVCQRDTCEKCAEKEHSGHALKLLSEARKYAAAKYCTLQDKVAREQEKCHQKFNEWKLHAGQLASLQKDIECTMASATKLTSRVLYDGYAKELNQTVQRYEQHQSKPPFSTKPISFIVWITDFTWQRLGEMTDNIGNIWQLMVQREAGRLQQSLVLVSGFAGSYELRLEIVHKIPDESIVYTATKVFTPENPAKVTGKPLSALSISTLNAKKLMNDRTIQVLVSVRPSDYCAVFRMLQALAKGRPENVPQASKHKETKTKDSDFGICRLFLTKSSRISTPKRQDGSVWTLQSTRSLDANEKCKALNLCLTKHGGKYGKFLITGTVRHPNKSIKIVVKETIEDSSVAQDLTVINIAELIAEGYIRASYEYMTVGFRIKQVGSNPKA